MKKLFLLLLIATSTAFAQDKAKTLLNEVSEKAKSYENISIAFKYVLENTTENIKQETRGKETDEENTVTPSKMLSFYEDGFTYKMDILQNVQGRKIQYVKLSPIDSNSEIKYILLGIDNNTKHIYNLIEIGKNSTKTTLTVNSFKTNEPISKTLFTFDKEKYSDYYINELD